ncbi:hypothetical protein ACJMK2_044384 [Sinanodonta woodiana]|uniref:START domain-containing protein n=1 Tax=Sinanodonta woodiana TaxID=1069815 RepID=A0ABD3VZY4_SINWO
MTYREKAMKIAETLKHYYEDHEGWKVSKKTKDGVTIFYRASREFDGYLYKGEAEINAPPKTVFHYVDPLPPEKGPRLKWDKSMTKVDIVEWLQEPELRINRCCTTSACMGLISPRDFVDLVYNIETSDHYITNGVSITTDKCPEDKSHVRGWNHPCAIFCRKLPNEPNKTKVTSLIQPDIGGMLPRTLVDSAIPGSMVEFFANLKKSLEENGHLVN